jgi:hypothetical protein
MINFNIGDVEAIITGLDNSGPHIWVVKNEDMVCFDKVGFAAIGAGEWHSKSQFMFAGYSKYWDFPGALLLTYTSKKRAEVAPGVGGDTDMFTIGPKLGSFTWIGDHVLQKLEEIYKAVKQEEFRITMEANGKVNEYVEEIIRASTVKEQATLPEDSGGDTSSDQKQLRDGSEESEPEDGNEQHSPS